MSPRWEVPLFTERLLSTGYSSCTKVTCDLKRSSLGLAHMGLGLNSASEFYLLLFHGSFVKCRQLSVVRMWALGWTVALNILILHFFSIDSPLADIPYTNTVKAVLLVFLATLKFQLIRQLTKQVVAVSCHIIFIIGKFWGSCSWPLLRKKSPKCNT